MNIIVSDLKVTDLEMFTRKMSFVLMCVFFSDVLDVSELPESSWCLNMLTGVITLHA